MVLPLSGAGWPSSHCRAGWLSPELRVYRACATWGSGPGADDHKVLFTHLSLEAMLHSVGFRVELLEWFDDRGTFHYVDWREQDGLIQRSRRFDPRNKNGELRYTSLIADGWKPTSSK